MHPLPLPCPKPRLRRSFRLLFHAHTLHNNAIGRNLEDRPDLGGLRSSVSTSMPRFSSGSVMLDPPLGSYCSESWPDSCLLLTIRSTPPNMGKQCPYCLTTHHGLTSIKDGGDPAASASKAHTSSCR